MNFTQQEIIALRWMLDKWGMLSRESAIDAPFVYENCESILEKLGGPIQLQDDMRGLRDYPLVKEWYEEHETCDNCGHWFMLKEMEEKSGLIFCKKCQK